MKIKFEGGAANIEIKVEASPKRFQIEVALKVLRNKDLDALFRKELAMKMLEWK